MAHSHYLHYTCAAVSQNACQSANSYLLVFIIRVSRQPIVMAMLDRPLYMSTKNTILKAYDGRFLQIFQASPAYAHAHCTYLCSF